MFVRLFLQRTKTDHAVDVHPQVNEPFRANAELAFRADAGAHDARGVFDAAQGFPGICGGVSRGARPNGEEDLVPPMLV